MKRVHCCTLKRIFILTFVDKADSERPRSKKRKCYLHVPFLEVQNLKNKNHSSLNRMNGGFVQARGNSSSATLPLFGSNVTENAPSCINAKPYECELNPSEIRPTFRAKLDRSEIISDYRLKES